MRLKHLVILLIVFGLLLAPLPLGPLVGRWPALAHTLENSAHPLLFWWLAAVLLRSFRVGLPSAVIRYIVTFLACLVLALGTEYLQSLLGRDSSWEDARNDMLGALFALLLGASRESAGRPRARAWAACGAVVVAAVAAFPLAWICAAYAWRATAFPVLWQSDAPLARPFSYWKQDAYPGLVLDEPARDWRGYSSLELRLRSRSAEGTRVNLRVHDVAHNHQFSDRYNAGFDLKGSGEQTLRIPLERIQRGPATRELDLSAIRGLVVFQEYGNEPPRFVLQDIRLVP